MANHNYNLRNTFWSEDYTTGIDCLIHRITTDVNELKQSAHLYTQFGTKFWAEATKSLSKIIVDNQPAHNGYGTDFYHANEESLPSSLYRQQMDVLGVILEEMKFINCRELENTCLNQLESLLFEYQEFSNETQEILNRNLRQYSRSLASAKSSREDLYKRSERIKNVYLAKTEFKSLEDDSNETSDDNCETNDTQQSVLDSEKSVVNTKEVDNAVFFQENFPLTLSKSLVFESVEDFRNFLSKLTSQVPLKKRLISIPGLRNEYFSGNSLFSTVKKVIPKLDTSLFNLECIGQRLLELRIINTYNGMISGSNGTFITGGYYEWTGELEEWLTAPKKSETLAQKKDNQNTEESTGNKLTEFFSSALHWNQEAPITCREELVISQKELYDREESYFQHCEKLDYARVQLELELNKAMKTYDSMFRRKCQLMEHASNGFVQLVDKTYKKISEQLTESYSTCEIDINTECYRMYSGNHGTIGYFTPQPSLSFVKFDSRGQITTSAIFNTDLRDLPVSKTEGTELKHLPIMLYEIVKHLYGCDAREVLESWGCCIDLIRVTNLRRDIIAEYKKCEGDHERTIKNVLNRIPSGNVSDIVGLLKLWLLELPDSVIPLVCYETLMQNDVVKGLRLIPVENLTSLLCLCKHFHWLIKEFDLVSVEKLFSLDGDVPLYHIFARHRERQPRDVVEYSKIVAHILCDEKVYGALEELLQELETQTIEKEEARILEEPVFTEGHTKNRRMPTLTLEKLNVRSEEDKFVPRPFKTLSAEPSPTKSSSRSRSNSKRLSGLNLLTSATSDSAASPDSQESTPPVPATVVPRIIVDH